MQLQDLDYLLSLFAVAQNQKNLFLFCGADRKDAGKPVRLFFFDLNHKIYSSFKAIMKTSVQVIIR